MTRTTYLHVETLNDEIVAVHGTPEIGTIEGVKERKERRDSNNRSIADKIFDFLDTIFFQVDETKIFFPAPSTKIWDYLNERGREGWELVETTGETPCVYILRKHHE